MNTVKKMVFKRITLVAYIVMVFLPTHLMAESMTIIELQKNLSEKAAIMNSAVAEMKAQELQGEKAMSLAKKYKLKKEGPDKLKAREDYFAQSIKILGDKVATNKKLRTLIEDSIEINFQIQEEQKKDMNSTNSQLYSTSEKPDVEDSLSGLMDLYTDTGNGRDGEYGYHGINHYHYLILEGLVAQVKQENSMGSRGQGDAVFYVLAEMQSVLNLQQKALKRQYNFFRRTSLIGVGQSVSRQIQDLVTSFGGAQALFNTGKMNQLDMEILGGDSGRVNTHVPTRKPDLYGLAARIKNL